MAKFNGDSETQSTTSFKTRALIHWAVYFASSSNAGVRSSLFVLGTRLRGGRPQNCDSVPGWGKKFLCTPKRLARLWRPVLLFIGAGSTVLEAKVTVVMPTISSRSKINISGSLPLTSPRTSTECRRPAVIILYCGRHGFISRSGGSIRPFAVYIDLVIKLLVQCIKVGHDRFFAHSFNSLFAHYSLIQHYITD